MFTASRVMDAIWPEGMGVLTYVGGAVVMAALDASRAKVGEPAPTPWAQNIFTGGALIGGILGIGYNKAPQFCTGLVYGSGVGIMANSVRVIYDRVTGQPQRIKASDVMALVPRRMVQAGGGSGQLGTIAIKDIRRGSLGKGGDETEFVVSTVPAGVKTKPRYE